MKKAFFLTTMLFFSATAIDAMMIRHRAAAPEGTSVYAMNAQQITGMDPNLLTNQQKADLRRLSLSNSEKGRAAKRFLQRHGLLKGISAKQAGTPFVYGN